MRSRNSKGERDAWGWQQNMQCGMSTALRVWKLGAAVFCPMGNTMWFDGADGVDDSTWLQGDLVILSKCDAMVMSYGWQKSQGALGEREFAKAHNIPVFDTVDDLQRWLAMS